MLNFKRTKFVLSTILSGLVFTSVVFANDEAKAPTEEEYKKDIGAIFNTRISDVQLDPIVELKEYQPTILEQPTQEIVETQEYTFLEVTAYQLNIRKTPGLEQNPVGFYNKGDMIIAHAKTNNGWYRLSSGYYVRDKYVKILTDIQTYDEFVKERDRRIEERKKKMEQEKINAQTSTTQAIAKIAGSVYTSIRMTQHERDYLARLIKCEAGGEPFEGQVAVAKVVFNRVLDSRFPNTVKDVINAKNQFTPVSTGKINRVQATKTQYDAIDAALASNDNLGGAVYFYAPSLVKSSWFESLKTVAVIGVHHFKVN